MVRVIVDRQHGFSAREPLKSNKRSIHDAEGIRRGRYALYINNPAIRTSFLKYAADIKV